MARMLAVAITAGAMVAREVIHAFLKNRRVRTFGRTTPSKGCLTRRRQLAQQNQRNNGEHRGDPEHSAHIRPDFYVASPHIGHSFWLR